MDKSYNRNKSSNQPTNSAAKPGVTQHSSKLIEELQRIEGAAMESYNKKDATGFRYKKIKDDHNSVHSKLGVGTSLRKEE